MTPVDRVFTVSVPGGEARERGGAPRPMMRRATITVEYEAEDCFDDRAREGEIRRVVEALRADFDRIAIGFTDRRPRHAPRAPAPSRMWSEG